MDPWPLSEKVQKSLQITVNHTPVPLPFRRYGWIHRGGFLQQTMWFLKIPPMK